MTLRLATLALLTLLCTRGHAQVMGNYQEQNQQRIQNYKPQFRAVPRAAQFTPDGKIQFTINALSNQRADSYVAIFTILQVGKTAAATNTGMNQRVDAILGALNTIGISREDIYVDMVNFLPTYAFETEKKIFSKKTLTEIPTGFQLQKNLHIRYRNPELLDQIVTACADQEVYDIVKVDYQVDDPQEVYTQLRKLAFDYLNTIEDIYVSQGMKLDSSQMLTAESAWVTYPGNRYESYTAFASQQLTSRERNDANVDRAQKPKLSFYNAIPANDYDVVVGADLLEPAAQFSYSLVVNYTLPPHKPQERVRVERELKTVYYLLTPEGTLRELPVGKE